MWGVGVWRCGVRFYHVWEYGIRQWSEAVVSAIAMQQCSTVINEDGLHTVVNEKQARELHMAKKGLWV